MHHLNAYYIYFSFYVLLIYIFIHVLVIYIFTCISYIYIYILFILVFHYIISFVFIFLLQVYILFILYALFISLFIIHLLLGGQMSQTRASKVSPPTPSRSHQLLLSTHERERMPCHSRHRQLPRVVSAAGMDREPHT